MKKIFLLSLLLSGLAANAQDILIYSGPGVGPMSLANTLAIIQALASPHYSVKTINAAELQDPAWIKKTALLVIPGGADLPYVENLNGKANANIKRFVNNGGKFLGICAGAYYAADYIEFAKGDAQLEVIGERELKFFPGVVVGPTYAGFSYDASNTAGMRAAKLFWQQHQAFTHGKEFTVFYYGGGHFVDAEKYANVEVLAHFNPESPDSKPQPAIVECVIGKGKAILSGAHFEWHPEAVQQILKQDHVIAKDLVAGEADRVLLAQHLLGRLDIALKEPSS